MPETSPHTLSFTLICPFCLYDNAATTKLPDKKIACKDCGRNFYGIRKPEQAEYPLLAVLATYYGTITAEQLAQALNLEKTARRKGAEVPLEQLFIQYNMASPKQVDLLLLIKNFIELREKSEAFGRAAIVRGYLTADELARAFKRQEKEFKQKRVNILIGDILMEEGVLSQAQCELILKVVSGSIAGIPSSKTDDKEISRDSDMALDNGVNLTAFEKKFLKIQELDKKFGEIAVQKGLVSDSQVAHALQVQEQMFRKLEMLKQIGDIFTEEGVLSDDQCREIYQMIESPSSRVAQPSSPPVKPVETVRGKIDVTDDHVELYVAPDKMTAHLTIKKRVPAGATPGDIRRFLKSKGIIFGVLGDKEIKQFLNKRDKTQIRIATGKPPRPGEGEEIAYFFDIGFPMKYVGGKKEKEKMEEVVVPRGKILAEKTPGTDPRPGVDIFGNAVNTVHHIDACWRLGKGARFSSDGLRIIAGNEGVPRLSIDGKIYVFSKTNILDDADVKTGPLGENSNISVMGTLKGAYPVRGGDVKAGEIRDADIDVVGDVQVDVGITNAKIVAQGAVVARYIMNSDIEAYGDVVVENEIIDSTILTSGVCIVRKSRIIASAITAKKGIIAQAVGSHVTNPCALWVGRNRHVETVFERMETDIERRKTELEKKEAMISRLNQKTQHVMARVVRLKKNIEHTALAKSRLMKKNAKPTPASARTPLTPEKLEAQLKKQLGSLKKAEQTAAHLKKAITRVQDELNAEKPMFLKFAEEAGQDLHAIRNWSHHDKGRSIIKINGVIEADTVISGKYSSFTLEKPRRHIGISEFSDKLDGADNWAFKPL